jgi:hypothetical protein
MHVKLTLAHSDVIGGMQTFAAPGTDNRTADDAVTRCQRPKDRYRESKLSTWYRLAAGAYILALSFSHVAASEAEPNRRQ